MAKEHLDIKEFVEGKCFICGKPCDPESYCHFECALAYANEKEKRIREAQIREDERKDKQQHNKGSNNRESM